jgi:hypothetical protein
MSAREFGQWQVFLSEEEQINGEPLHRAGLGKLMTVIANSSIAHPDKRAWRPTDFMHQPWEQPSSADATDAASLKQALAAFGAGQ